MADIRDEVADRIRTYGRGGGYIVSTAHNIQADTPPENAIALLNAYHDLGKY